MAVYKGREALIVRFVPVEYKVEIRVEKNNYNDTVKLSEVTMTNKELMDFIKGEHKRLEDERAKVPKGKEEAEVIAPAPKTSFFARKQEKK